MGRGEDIDSALILDSDAAGRGRAVLAVLPAAARRRRDPAAPGAAGAVAMETVVRMGEASASSTPGDVLACIGLGSCIGLALVDRSARRRRAGATSCCPRRSRPDPPQPHKFADLAVPRAARPRAGPRRGARPRLEAALVGGAAMFQFGGSGAGHRRAQRGRGPPPARRRSACRSAPPPPAAARAARSASRWAPTSRSPSARPAAREEQLLGTGPGRRWSHERVPGRQRDREALRARQRGQPAGRGRAAPRAAAPAGCAPSTSRARRSSPPTRSGASAARWTPSPSAPSTRLVAEHRTPIEMEVIDVGQFTWTNAFAQVPDGSVLVTIDTAPHDGRMLLTRRAAGRARRAGADARRPARDRVARPRADRHRPDGRPAAVRHDRRGALVGVVRHRRDDAGDRDGRHPGRDGPGDRRLGADAVADARGAPRRPGLDDDAARALRGDRARRAPRSRATTRRSPTRDPRTAAAVNHGLSLVDVSLRAEVADTHADARAGPARCSPATSCASTPTPTPRSPSSPTARPSTTPAAAAAASTAPSRSRPRWSRPMNDRPRSLPWVPPERAGLLRLGASIGGRPGRPADVHPRRRRARLGRRRPAGRVAVRRRRWCPRSRPTCPTSTASPAAT